MVSATAKVQRSSNNYTTYLVMILLKQVFIFTLKNTNGATQLCLIS